MKVFVISLKSVEERRKYMKSQLNRLGISYTFFDALAPADLDTKLFTNRPEILSKEAIATFESHRAVIEKAKELQEPILVLEDDATILVDDFLNQVEKLASTSLEYDLLFIGYMERGISGYIKKGFLNYQKKVESSDGLFCEVGSFIGLHSYIVNPLSADKILTAIGEPDEHIDAKISNIIQNGGLSGLFSQELLTKQNRDFTTQIPKQIHIAPLEKNFNKIFQIGFNKCGTTSLHNFFKANMLRSVHWDGGRLAKTIKHNFETGQDILTGYQQYDCYTDMENATNDIFAYVSYFKEFDRQYPNSKFILNIRPLDKWIASRLKHGRCTYVKIYEENFEMEADAVVEMWKADWEKHTQAVIDYFKDRPDDLLIFDIESESSKLIRFMSKLVALKNSDFGQFNITKER